MNNNKTHNAGNQADAIKAEFEKHKQRDNSQRFAEDRNWSLSREDARGGSPGDVSVGGEEDAGVGLEFLVRNESLNSTARSREGYPNDSAVAEESADEKTKRNAKGQPQNQPKQ